MRPLSNQELDDLAQRVAQRLYPYLWDGDFESKLSQLSPFSPEQARESAKRQREEKAAETRDIATAVIEDLKAHPLEDL